MNLDYQEKKYITGNKSCVVVVPVYQDKLDSESEFGLLRSLPNLSEYKIILLAPEELDLSYYKNYFGIDNEIRFDKKFFQSTESYSRLFLSEEFYERLCAYEFMLILQTDAIVLKPELDYWIDQGYDYIGAPWKLGYELPAEFLSKFNNKKLISCRFYVGNGGLSLRRIKNNLELIRNFPDVAEFWRITGSAEDLFFSCIGLMSSDFRIPNIMTAARFSHETDPSYMYQLIGDQLPFGVHAWTKYDKQHWLKLFDSQDSNIN